MTVKAAGRPRGAGRAFSSGAGRGHPDQGRSTAASSSTCAGADRLLPRVVTAAEGGGFEVADLSVSEPSLETVFINLTGKELRD